MDRQIEDILAVQSVLSAVEQRTYRYFTLSVFQYISDRRRANTPQTNRKWENIKTFNFYKSKFCKVKANTLLFET